MKYSTRTFAQSYAMLVAEDAATYHSEATDPRKPAVVSDSAGRADTAGSANLGSTASEATADQFANLANLAKRGPTLLLAMALIDGAGVAAADRQANAARLRTLTERAAGQGVLPVHDPVKPVPLSDDALTDRLKRLVRTSNRNLAEQLQLFLQIDERGLWRKAGCRDMLHWMDSVLGIGRVAGLERLRVARALRSLPVIESLFALGKLSWSKVRELTRVADAVNEQALAAAALNLSASETTHLCQRWRHDARNTGRQVAGEGSGNGSDGSGAGSGSGTATGEPDGRVPSEAEQAMKAWESRSLTWRQRGDGTTRITLDLPHHSAAEFLKALEAQEDLLRENESQADAPSLSALPNTSSTSSTSNTSIPTPRQRRADAAMVMSASALAHAGEPVASADRYRVLVNIDARLLGEYEREGGTAPPGELAAERPTIPGFGPIAVATARRLASQARLTVIATDTDGEVAGTGRDTRLFSAASIRAITARDRCCQMPGCTRTRWLQAHHVVPWSQGGGTTVSNGALVCSACHTRLHEGGLRLERVHRESVALPDDDTLTMTTDEQAEARAMIATVQRFRLLDRKGNWLAGPRWRVGASPRAEEESRAPVISSAFPRGNKAEPLSRVDQLAQYREPEPLSGGLCVRHR